MTVPRNSVVQSAVVGPKSRNRPAETPERPNDTGGTVVRVVRVLAELADAEGPVGVGQLAKSVGLAPSTIHRLLAILREQAMVSWDPILHQYTPGPEFYRIAARVMSGVGLKDLADPVLFRLAEQFNETVLLGMYLPGQQAMTFIGRADGTQLLQYRIEMNTRLSLVWGASGKAILAYLDESQVAEILREEGASPAGGTPVPRLQDLLRQLAEVRRDGYAVSEGEKLPGAHGVAVPIFDSKGVIGSLCLTSPADRLQQIPLEHVSRTLIDEATRLSQTLGAAPPAALGQKDK